MDDFLLPCVPEAWVWPSGEYFRERDRVKIPVDESKVSAGNDWVFFHGR
ncbi:hypothetical protein [Paraburkholderia gardini]|nr:hypothetical protein [Paraburkholderia gardini]